MSYFDAAAGTPLHPVARQALLAAQEDGWADPSKLYAPGRRARQLLDAARAAIADELGVRPDEVLFCASGTDAVRAGVRGAVLAQNRKTVVHSAIEHSAVLHAVSGPHAVSGGLAAGSGGLAVSVPVDRLGRVDIEAFNAAAAGPDVAVAALISASHEVGTVQPVEQVVPAGVPLLVDAAQSVGRVPLPDGWSLLAASAHKWGGPAGVGILVVRKGTRWIRPWPDGADQPGASNIPALVAAAAALRAASAEAESEARRLYPLIERIRTQVAATVPDVEIVGDPVHRLPHLVTFSCLYLDGETLLHGLDRAGFAVSSGSSCTASTLRPSHVLAAMGVLSHGNIRVSLHRESTEAEVDRFLAVLPGLVAELRAEAGVVGL